MLLKRYPSALEMIRTSFTREAATATLQVLRMHGKMEAVKFAHSAIEFDARCREAVLVALGLEEQTRLISDLSVLKEEMMKLAAE